MVRTSPERIEWTRIPPWSTHRQNSAQHRVKFPSTSWNRCANPGSDRALRPVREPRVPARPGGQAAAPRPAPAGSLSIWRWKRTTASRRGAHVRERALQGEYVFDYCLGRCLAPGRPAVLPEAAGQRAVHPATGRRLLTPDAGPGTEQAAARRLRAGQRADRRVVPALTFMPERQWELAGELGYLQRMDQQYHWHNPATRRSTTFSAICHRKSARTCAGSDAKPWPTASRSNG